MNTSGKRLVARSQHWCDTCQRKIGVGESYWRSRCWDGAEAWTFRQCWHCCVVTDMYDPRDSDDLISLDAFVGWTEDSARGLPEARAMAGWRHKWRTQSGALWPVPTREEASHDRA